MIWKTSVILTHTNIHKNIIQVLNTAAKHLISTLQPRSRKNVKKIIIDVEQPSKKRKLNSQKQSKPWVGNLTYADGDLILSATGWMNSSIVSEAR